MRGPGARSGSGPPAPEARSDSAPPLQTPESGTVRQGEMGDPGRDLPFQNNFSVGRNRQPGYFSFNDLVGFTPQPAGQFILGYAIRRFRTTYQIQKNIPSNHNGRRHLFFSGNIFIAVNAAVFTR